MWKQQETARYLGRGQVCTPSLGVRDGGMPERGDEVAKCDPTPHPCDCLVRKRVGMARLESFDCFCYLQLEVRAVRGGLQGVSAYAAIHNIVAQEAANRPVFHRTRDMTGQVICQDPDHPSCQKGSNVRF